MPCMADNFTLSAILGASTATIQDDVARISLIVSGTMRRATGRYPPLPAERSTLAQTMDDTVCFQTKKIHRK